MLEGVCSCLERKITKIHRVFEHNRQISRLANRFDPDPKKSTREESPLFVLFKKSKIIKIGSVEKKLQLREVGAFWKKYGNAGIFVPEICDFGSETVPQLFVTLKKSRISKCFAIK